MPSRFPIRAAALAGGVLLASTLLPAQATALEVLKDQQLDTVTAGLSAAAEASATAFAVGSRNAGTRTRFSLRANGSPRLVTVAGYSYGFAFGIGDDAAATATSSGDAVGDFSRTHTTSMRGGSGQFKWAFSATVVVAASFDRPRLR